MLFLGCIITNSSEYLNTPFEKDSRFFGMLCLCEGKNSSINHRFIKGGKGISKQPWTLSQLKLFDMKRVRSEKAMMKSHA